MPALVVEQVSAAKILVADDDRDTAETLADLLRLHGYEVRVAFNGREAAEVARLFLPGLAILDINMPVLDGYEAARLIISQKAVAQTLVLVALTSNASPADVGFARLAGFDHHLPKGIGSDVLLALVDALIVSHRLARESPTAYG